MGLYIARALVEAHGGTLACRVGQSGHPAVQLSLPWQVAPSGAAGSDASEDLPSL